MERTIVVALFASLALLGGCDRNENMPGTDRPANRDPLAEKNPQSDRGPLGGMNDPSKPVTPLQQGNSPAELEVTANIRKAVMEADNLSQSAKNVTIVTSNGVVTLRGEVKDEVERKIIEKMAQVHSAGNRVDNQLVLATQDIPVR